MTRKISKIGASLLVLAVATTIDYRQSEAKTIGNVVYRETAKSMLKKAMDNQPVPKGFVGMVFWKRYRYEIQYQCRSFSRAGIQSDIAEHECHTNGRSQSRGAFGHE